MTLLLGVHLTSIELFAGQGDTHTPVYRLVVHVFVRIGQILRLQYHLWGNI